MTLEKACSDTEIFLAVSGIEPGTSSTRGKCLTTELPHIWAVSVQLFQACYDSALLLNVSFINVPLSLTFQSAIPSYIQELTSDLIIVMQNAYQHCNNKGNHKVANTLLVGEFRQRKQCFVNSQLSYNPNLSLL